MSKLVLPLVALGALTLLSLDPHGDPLAADRATATLFPTSTAVYVEGDGLAEVFAQGTRHPLVAHLLASPLGQALGGEAALDAPLAQAREQLGTELLPTLARMTARGAGLGLAPRGSKPAWALALHADDADWLEETVQALLDRAGERFGFPRAFRRPHDTVRGADVWYVGDELVVARRGALLVLTNEGGYGRDVLDLAADAEATGLVGHDSFALPARETRTLAAWVDLDRLRDLPTGAGGDRGLRGLAELPTKPEVYFLLGPSVAALGTAAQATAWIDLDGEAIAAGVEGLGVDEMAALRQRERATGPLVPRSHADDVATATLSRDLAAVFAERAELFAPDLQPQLAKPLSELAVLFGGRDLSEDVLPGLSPWLTLVSRRVAFDEGARPDIELPALAAVVELDDPEVLGPRLTAAFQTLVAITNVERAQQAEDPMVLSLEREGDTSVTRAAFLAPHADEGVDLRYNLEPACARVGGLFVLGTHEVLVRQLVREIEGGEVAQASARGERLRLEGAAVADFVARNFDALVMNKVLDEGVEYSEAEEDITGLRMVTEMIDGLELTVVPDGDRVSLSLALQLESETERMR